VAQHINSSLSLTTLLPYLEMSGYTLKFTVVNPTLRVSFLEFSTTGGLLAVGSGNTNTIHLLDRSSDFQPTMRVTTRATPASLVWRDHKSFVAGLSDGSIIEYDLDLGAEGAVVNRTVHNAFKGSIPISAVALEPERDLLVVIVGPDVLRLRRNVVTGVATTFPFQETTENCPGKFEAFANLSNRNLFEREPGVTVLPFPRSLYFSPSGTLVVSYCRQNVV